MNEIDLVSSSSNVSFQKVSKKKIFRSRTTDKLNTLKNKILPHGELRNQYSLHSRHVIKRIDMFLSNDFYIPDSALPADIQEELYPLADVLSRDVLDAILYRNNFSFLEKEKLLKTLLEISNHFKLHGNKAHYHHKEKLCDEKGTPLKDAKGKASYNSYSWFIDNDKNIFIIDKKISEGAAKRVNRGFCLNTLESLAVISGKVKSNPDNEYIIRQNADNLKFLNEIGISNIAPSDTLRLEASTKGGLIKSIYTQALFDGDASFLVPDFPRILLSDEEKKKIIQASVQILDALASLHKQGYVHLDVKPENIFIYKNNAFLADFDGLSRKNSSFNFEDFSVTPLYLSPELDEHKEGEITLVRPAQDAYAMGVTMLTFFFSKAVGNKFGYCKGEIAQNFMESRYKIREDLKDLGFEGKELTLLVRVLSGLTHPDQNRRMSCRKALDLMKKLIT